jgi:hypothetical protein
MKYVSRKNVLKYLYDQLTGNFAGFIVGMSASGLVSNFFETRSIRNLWGITSRKTVVSKEMFGALEWIISILIGFIVFEIMTKVVKERLDRHMPAIKRIVFRWIIRNNFRIKTRELVSLMENKRAVLFGAFNSGLRKTISRSSRP